MATDINDIARIKWGCRRGMLELDIVLLPFFEAEYQLLSDDDKGKFVNLLEEADPDIYAWLMGHRQPDTDANQSIINTIMAYNRSLL